MPTENQSQQSIIHQFAAIENVFPESVSNVLSKESSEKIRRERELQQRARARQQRDRGRERLKKRYAGAISKVLTVTLNERSAGSTFERFYADLENDLFTIVRIGNIELSKSDHGILLDVTEKQLEVCEQFFKQERARAELLLQNHSDVIDELDYTEPAIGIEIQVRTRHADWLIDIFHEFDSLITEMRKLEWAQVIEPNELSSMERKSKGQIFELRRFLVRQASRVRFRETENAESHHKQEVITTSALEDKHES